MSQGSIAHSVSIVLAVDADTAFEFMASGMNQTYWALGSWARVDEGDGVVSGTSLFDGSKLYIDIKADPKLRLIDYYVGVEKEALHHGVEGRVMAGEPLGHGPGSCVVTLTVWRGAADTDASWQRTCRAFEIEVYLIKGRLEHGVDAQVRTA
jgi:hypothetical protein